VNPMTNVNSDRINDEYYKYREDIRDITDEEFEELMKRYPQGLDEAWAKVADIYYD
jgi:hypothetical protein